MEEHRGGITRKRSRSRSRSPERRTSPGRPVQRRTTSSAAGLPPALGLLDALPEDCMLKIVSCVESKQDKDRIALTCRTLREMGSTFRHSFKFEYSAASDDPPPYYIEERGAPVDAADNSNQPETLNELHEAAYDIEYLSAVQYATALGRGLPVAAAGDEGDRPLHNPRTWSKLPQFLLQAVHAFPKILSITITGCDRNMATDLPVVDLSSVLVPPNFKDLTTLKIAAVDGIDDHFVAQLSSVCHNLTHLNLDHCRFLTDAAFHSLAAHCPELMFLKLHCFRDTLSDEGVGHFLLHCAAMTMLSLKGCTLVKGSGFENGRGLTRLEADECGITKDDIDKGLQGTRALRTLSLAYIDGMEDLGESIGQYCNGIEVLNLTESYGLHNSGIMHIVRSCPCLRVLRLNFCVGVDVQGWDAVAKHALKLEELEVRGCEEFCEESLGAIQTGCPRLRSLKLPQAFLPPNLAFQRFLLARPDVKIEIYDDDETFERLVYPAPPAAP